MGTRDNSNPALKSPDEWLEKVDPEKTRGTFKLFLGYAPGVGKTYNMLSEAIRRHARGEDIVIGIVETHGRPRTAELADQLEKIPRKTIEYKGVTFEEMDLDGILSRRPQIVLIDELAHSNIEGSKHRKRYEDVLDVLAANIDVLATMNVQHIESVAPTVQSVTGVQIRETVPDWLVQRADEIVMADLTPEALQTRMRRGDIYGTARAEKALANFFRRGNLIALRELALQHVTKAVDRTLTAYMDAKRIEALWAVRERVAVCVSSNSSSQVLIARGARVAEGVGGELFVLHVEDDDDLCEEDRATLAANMQFARNLDAQVFTIKGKSIAHTAAAFVREKRITHIVFGRTAVHGIRKYLYYWAIQHFLKESPNVDVHIVTQHPERE
ncbi:histidine kinase [Tunturiibacter lichenicola]|jgi:two-component system, OmpR family, sensor histidine kinase KdpD|uniref:histidine kinase n=1 Tax=Tunturiibacter lichenicola TaxID=2051959 RepID=UPI003D9AEA18